MFLCNAARGGIIEFSHSRLREFRIIEMRIKEICAQIILKCVTFVLFDFQEKTSRPALDIGGFGSQLRSAEKFLLCVFIAVCLLVRSGQKKMKFSRLGVRLQRGINEF